MDRYGRVRKLYEDGTALVVRTGICSPDCHQCSGCRELESIIARNPEGALPGELVQIRVRPGAFLLAALILYLLPVAAFFALYWAGNRWCNAGGAAGCVALAIGTGVALVYDRHAASKRGSGYTVTRISAKHK